MTDLCRATALAVVGLALASAAAAEPELPQSSDVVIPDRQYVLDLGLGVEVGPRYDGSDQYLAQPVPIIGIGRITLPYFGRLGGDDPKRGFFLFPTFDYIGSRDSSDDSDLKGLDDVDWALAAGFGVAYRYDWFRAFGQADYGFNGYSGLRARFGVDAVAEPFDRWSASLGPRISLAGGNYMDTYFRVSDAESAASGGRLAPYNPSGGLRAVGIAALASYAVTDSVFATFNARYDRLVGDAGDSPVVKVGSADQFTVAVGLSYRFSFDVFDE